MALTAALERVQPQGVEPGTIIDLDDGGTLLVVACREGGYARVRRGRGFSYHRADGSLVRDPDVRARIAALAIPPAWRDVWICEDPSGHLQAVGVDAAGRLQYRYHPDWRTWSDARKHRRVRAFARHLPELRTWAAAQVHDGEPDFEAALAAAFLLLDRAAMRIGNATYSEDNGSYGLTTVRRDHVRFRDGTATLVYPAKGGEERTVTVADPALVALLQRLARRRSGPDDLLAFKEAGRWLDLTAEHVNRWLREQVQMEASAKDFRTWHATVLAAVACAVLGGSVGDPATRRSVEAHVAEEVARALGNTPAVARSAYIDPEVFDRYRSGWTIAPALERLGVDVAPGEPAIHGDVEEAVLDLLEDPETSPWTAPDDQPLDGLAPSGVG